MNSLLCDWSDILTTRKLTKLGWGGKSKTRNEKKGRETVAMVLKKRSRADASPSQTVEEKFFNLSAIKIFPRCFFLSQLEFLTFDNDHN